MPETHWRCRPTESFEYFRNPHKGCATFQHFAGDPLFDGTTWSEEGPTEFPPRQYPDVTPGYLPSTVAYCRWFWRRFQPAKDTFDWTLIDQALQTAHERGQTLQVRLMPYGSARQPCVPDWYRDVAPVIPTETKGTTLTTPDHCSDEFFHWWGRVVGEFAARYDGHPDLESFDISHIGPWGEGAAYCSDDAIQRMAEHYVSCFRKTPLLAMVGGHQMRYAVSLGTGWRCDCFGDQRERGRGEVPHSLCWAHTFDAYPWQVAENGATDAWKNGPVVFETCGVPLGWYRQKAWPYDLDFNLRQGLKYHGSIFMPKSTRIPDEWQKPILDWCRSLGYRFVLRQARYSLNLTRSQPFDCDLWIENVGVAPLYHPYRLALRVVQDGLEHIVELETNLKTWLPGDICLRNQLPVPGGLKPGPAMLSAGIVKPGGKTPAIRFAVNEQDPNGWVDLGKVTVA
jgi:hypothetical protein